MEAIDIVKASTDLQSFFIRELNSRSDLENILDRLVNRTAEVLRASACSIFTIDKSGVSATQRAGSGYQKAFNGMGDVRVVPSCEVPEDPPEDEKLGLTGWILSTGKAFLARGPAEVAQHPHHSGRAQLTGEEIQLRSFLGVPVRGLEGRIIGCLKVERRMGDSTEKEGAFSDRDELALETFARVAGRCITYLNVGHQGRESEALTAWARDVVTEAVSTEGELDSFLDIVVKVTAAAMRADSCAIFLKDESGKTLTQRAGYGPSQELRKVIRACRLPELGSLDDCLGTARCDHCQNRRTLPRGSRTGLTAWIAATGKPFHAQNSEELQRHCHWLGAFDKWNFPKEEGTECGAFLGIPLRVGDTVLGVVKVENTVPACSVSPGDFPEPAQRRFEILAQDIALAIVGLQSQIPDRYGTVQAAQAMILEILRGGLEVPELVNKVVKQTRKLFNAGACALFLKEGDKLRQPHWAADGWAERGPEVREYDLVPREAITDDEVPKVKVGLTVWIAVTQTPFTAKSNTELLMHPHHIGKFDQFNFEGEERCESFMGFPMLIKEGDKNELVGVLKVETKKKKRGEAEDFTYFNELDERVCELIANSVAIAIQNARLLEYRRRAAWLSALQQSSQMVAHRLRNILPIASDYLDALARRRMPDLSADDWVRVALDQVRRAQRVVGDFEIFAKSERFDRPDRVLPRQLVSRLRREVENSLAQQGCQVVEVVRTEQPSVRVNLDRLRDDFIAFARDSVRHRPEGLRLEIAAEYANDEEIERAKLRPRTRYLKLVYRDNGPGVPRAQKEKIFEPFFTTTQGSGLGLAIAAHNARVHEGCIVESGEEGEGVRFEIYLPERG